MTLREPRWPVMNTVHSFIVRRVPLSMVHSSRMKQIDASGRVVNNVGSSQAERMAPMATLSTISRMIRPGQGPASPSPPPNIPLSPVDGDFDIPQQRPRARGGMPPPPEDLKNGESSQQSLNESASPKDSLTLGQLKAYMAGQPKTKVSSVLKH